jgi:beta-galactosidase
VKTFKTFIVLTIFVLFISVSVHSQRTETTLNGKWFFIVDKDNKGESLGWKNSIPAEASEVKVPHTFNLMPGLEDYAGKAWYERSFEVPVVWKTKSIRIVFEAVNHDATVYINGIKVAEHAGSGFTQFSANISNAVFYGRTNTLVVLTDNSYSGSNLPYKRSFDWVNDGGIIRGVKLIVSGLPSIRYVHITPIVNFTDSTGILSFSVKLNEGKINQTDFNIQAVNWKSGEVLFRKEINQKKKGSEFTFSIRTGKVKLWDLYQPNLYIVTVDVKKQNVISDTYKTRIGFREIKTKGADLMLNRKRVRLPGIEHMPGSNPNYGSAEPTWVMDSVVSMFNDLNIKITRLHWEADEYFINKLDENGILLQDEIPWWQQPDRLSPELMKIAKMHLTEMIERDFNHPSIFAWGLSNEVSHNGFSDIDTLKAFTEKLDNSRFVNVIGNSLGFLLKKDYSAAGDILTWNEYTGTWFDFDKDTLLIPKLQNIAKELPGRPLLITEHGLCEPIFVGGDQKRITTMIYHYTEWSKQPFIMGCIYFCLSDYRTQAGENGSGKFSARIHGITDMFLKKKSSFAVYKNLTRPIEILKLKKINEKTVEIELLNKDALPSYTCKGFIVSYINKAGNTYKVTIPTMEPGEKKMMRFENVADRYDFKIIAPNGVFVNGYPIDK